MKRRTCQSDSILNLNVMPKRRHTEPEDIDAEEVIEGINLNKGILDGLLDLNRDELAAVLAHSIANEGNISTASFKMARTALPSFSTEKWTEFALQFGQRTNPEIVILTPYSTPRFRLPPLLPKDNVPKRLALARCVSGDNRSNERGTEA
jgi:hypothetical protein